LSRFFDGFEETAELVKSNLGFATAAFDDDAAAPRPAPRPPRPPLLPRPPRLPLH